MQGRDDETEPDDDGGECDAVVAADDTGMIAQQESLHVVEVDAGTERDES